MVTPDILLQMTATIVGTLVVGILFPLGGALWVLFRFLRNDFRERIETAEANICHHNEAQLADVRSDIEILRRDIGMLRRDIEVLSRRQDDTNREMAGMSEQVATLRGFMDGYRERSIIAFPGTKEPRDESG